MRSKGMSISELLKEILCAVALTVSVIPGFELIGDIVLQVVVTEGCSLFVIVVFDLIFKAKPEVFFHSLALMTGFWVVLALVEQISFHITSGDFSFRWFYLFYYDKPAMLFVVFFVCILYFIIKLLLNKNNESFIMHYSKFIKGTTITFLIYYVIILFYSFFLVRNITFEKPVVNLKPFEMMIFTFSRGYLDYELLFLFLGNIMIFLPLGVLISALTKRKTIIILTPIIVSFGIELSQYFLGNGHPDIDDFILNVSGFYAGVGIRILLDCAVRKATKGKFNSFFIFSKQTSDTKDNQNSCEKIC